MATETLDVETVARDYLQSIDASLAAQATTHEHFERVLVELINGRRYTLVELASFRRLMRKQLAAVATMRTLIQEQIASRAGMEQR